MASGFVGYAVLVTLSSPPNAQLRGTVANIVGQRLTLHDVTLWNGQRSPSYTIDAAIIADLEVSSTHSQTASQTVNRTHPVIATSVPDITHQRLSQDHLQVPARPQPEPFVDPAILSFSTASTRTTTKQTPVAALISRSDSFLGSPSSVLSVETARPSQPTERHDSAVTATLTEPFSNITLDKTKIDGEDESTLHPIQGRLKKHGKRGGRNKRQDHAGHGWRQTAFVEPARPRLHTGYPADENPIVSAHTRQHKNKNRNNYAENSNGWATEDATDIQELGDFDFEGNLSKFDKRRVFDEIRNDDTTADEDRLVSFNKRPRPGTNGGKNLHWSENVLDNTPAQWNSEAGETETESSDDKFSSGNYSNRDKSKPSGRSQMTKKAAVNNSQLATNASLGSTGRNSIPSPRNISPMPHRQSGRTSPLNGANNVSSSGTLRLTTTNRLCPTVSPLQMLEIEQLAVTELGLTEDMIVENAGRGIAEAAVGRLGSEAAAPSVLVFTGNHRTGGRAIAAARHLKNRGHRVTLCLLGLEHETELVENCRKQLEIFKKIGGRVLRWEQLSTRLLTPDFSVDLVIDALFGMHIAFEDLRSDDQAAACEMIAWINRSKLVVVSVDIPSGISAATGDVGVVQGSRLSIISDSVVCLAAPKTGVVNALDSGEGSSWKVTVADIGISQVVWRKYGTRRRHGVDFGNRWVVSLKYQPAAA